MKGKQQARDHDDARSDAFYEARKHDVEQRLKPERFKHALGVADTAQSLARLYGVDELKARLAGLLHDWDKNYDNEGIRRRVKELGLSIDPSVFEEMPQLLHGPTAAAALARDYPQIPRDVIEAIARHTTGAIDMTDLDMVVYVADGLEPGRAYQGVPALRDLVGKVSLEELYLEVFRHVLLHLIERHKRVHPHSIEVWNFYIARAREAASTKSQEGTP